PKFSNALMTAQLRLDARDPLACSHQRMKRGGAFSFVQCLPGRDRYARGRTSLDDLYAESASGVPSTCSGERYFPRDAGLVGLDAALTDWLTNPMGDTGWNNNNSNTQ